MKVKSYIRETLARLSGNSDKAIAERIKSNGSRGTITSKPIVQIYNSMISAYKPINV